MTPEVKEWLRSYLAEGMHTAFRKGSDHRIAGGIHMLISKLPASEWNNIVLFVSEAMIDGLEHRATKGGTSAPGDTGEGSPSEVEELQACLRTMRTVFDMVAHRLDVDIHGTKVNVKVVNPAGEKTLASVSIADCFAEADRLTSKVG